MDPRFDPSLLCALKRRGFVLEPSMPGLPPGLVDTGFPTLAVVTAEGIEGMAPDASHITGSAAGD